MKTIRNEFFVHDMFTIFLNRFGEIVKQTANIECTPRLVLRTAEVSRRLIHKASPVWGFIN